MNKNLSGNSRFKGLRIAITGANGSLGGALVEILKKKGAYVVGLTHDRKKSSSSSESNPDEWILWNCGKEEDLRQCLSSIDILILNHGFNPKQKINSIDINNAIEINSLSHWKLIEIFENLALSNNLSKFSQKEVWVNLSLIHI